MYRQRLIKQAMEAAKKQFNQFLLMFDEQNMLQWQAFIEGPLNTAYQGYIFLVKISLTSDYPITPPKMFFKTKIFHPNIHFITGEVCLDIIKNEWSPTWTLEALCRALRYLLDNPNADSPLNCDAANLIRLKERQAYDTLASMYSKMYGITKSKYLTKTKQF